MRYYVAINAAVVAARLAEAGFPTTVAEAYMDAERRFDPVARKPVQITTWVPKREQATAFLSEEDAWAAFDRSGHGRREDYEVIS